MADNADSEVKKRFIIYTQYHDTVSEEIFRKFEEAKIDQVETIIGLDVLFLYLGLFTNGKICFVDFYSGCESLVSKS